MTGRLKFQAKPFCFPFGCQMHVKRNVSIFNRDPSGAAMHASAFQAKVRLIKSGASEKHRYFCNDAALTVKAGWCFSCAIVVHFTVRFKLARKVDRWVWIMQKPATILISTFFLMRKVTAHVSFARAVGLWSFASLLIA